MEFSILTYNVLFNRAVSKLRSVIEQKQPDILCFQEIETNEPNLQSLEHDDYRLADFSNSFIKFGTIYGVATYYNTKCLTHINTEIISLPKSIYEVIVTIIRLLRGGNRARTVLRTDFIHKKTNRRITVYNTHLSSFGSNSIRYKQLEKMLRDIHPTVNHALLVAGDFNHLPYQRKKLEDLVHSYGLREATNELPFTFTYDFSLPHIGSIQRFLGKLWLKIVPRQIKIDYIFYAHVLHEKTERLKNPYSDHFPVLSTFTLKPSGK